MRAWLVIKWALWKCTFRILIFEGSRFQERNPYFTIQGKYFCSVFQLSETMEKFKAILLINPYHFTDKKINWQLQYHILMHYLIHYLCAGITYFCLEASACCACYRDYIIFIYDSTEWEHLWCWNFPSIQPPSSFLHMKQKTVGIFSWKPWHLASLIKRFTNFPLLNRIFFFFFWHFSLLYKLFLIN